MALRRQLPPSLAPAGGDDRSPCSSAHPDAKAVRLGPATIIRLIRALAHCHSKILVLRPATQRRCRQRRLRQGTTKPPRAKPHPVHIRTAPVNPSERVMTLSVKDRIFISWVN